MSGDSVTVRPNKANTIRCVGFPTHDCKHLAVIAATVGEHEHSAPILALCRDCTANSRREHQLHSSWGSRTAVEFAADFRKYYPSLAAHFDFGSKN